MSADAESLPAASTAEKKELKDLKARKAAGILSKGDRKRLAALIRAKNVRVRARRAATDGAMPNKRPAPEASSGTAPNTKKQRTDTVAGPSCAPTAGGGLTKKQLKKKRQREKRAAARAAAEAAAGLEPLPADAKPGDWMCVCGAHNFADKAECHKCGAAPVIPRSKRSGRASKRSKRSDEAGGQGPCYDFQKRGFCSRGDECRFAHVEAEPDPEYRVDPVRVPPSLHVPHALYHTALHLL